MDTSRYQGTGQFGKAYGTMLEKDTHAPGSVDRVLAEKMVRLCAETADYLYMGYSPTSACKEKALVRCWNNAWPMPGHPKGLQRTGWPGSSTSAAVLGSVLPTTSMRCASAGPREQIVARGSEWCTDVARVACAMCQVAGVPARLVSLVNLSQAYSGHQFIEAFNEGVWGAVDPLDGVLYRRPDGRQATTWELMNDDRLVRGNWQEQSSFFADPRQFEAAAIVNYPIWRASSFDYTVSSLNDYTRRVLEMADEGWAGGLRWLHGEESK